MSRLSIEIDPIQHRQIKTLATYEGMTIKEFILSKTIAPKNPDTQKGDTTEKLLSHPKNKIRLMEAIKAPTSENRVFETIDDLKDALGI